MPITAQQAWDATDPSQDNEARQRSAEAIMAGVAANDAYLSSRSELERLRALAEGGQVVSHADLNSGGDQEEKPAPTIADIATGAVDGTAEDEPNQPALSPGPTSTGADTVPAGGASKANPETGTDDTVNVDVTPTGVAPPTKASADKGETEAVLHDQLKDAGVEPVKPSPGSDTEAALRKQLEDAGLKPEV